MLLTFKYRSLTSRKGRLELVETQRVLYNHALWERIGCYKRTVKTISYFDQCKTMTEYRRNIPEMAAIHVQLQRGTLNRLDEAFKAFFRQFRSGQEPGLSRFMGKGWFDTLEFAGFSGIRFDGMRIRSKTFENIRVHLYRKMEGKIKSCRIVRDGKQWYVCLICKVEVVKKKIIKSMVGLDVCLENLATLISGEHKVGDCLKSAPGNVILV